jgi:hypothetical protein
MAGDHRQHHAEQGAPSPKTMVLHGNTSLLGIPLYTILLSWSGEKGNASLDKSSAFRQFSAVIGIWREADDSAP